MKNTVYFVYREGVYMQGLWGIYEEDCLALEAAKKFINEEPDDYHIYYVGKAVLGQQLTTLSNYGNNTPIIEIIKRGNQVQIRYLNSKL